MERRGESGQILPGLLMVLLAILAVGVLFFQVGKAAVLKSQAQTAADAAALAGAREIRDQLLQQYTTFGATSISAIDYALVEAKMRHYAALNDGHIVGRPVFMGVDVKVNVNSDQKLGKDSKDIDEENRQGEAHARARVTLTVAPVGGIGGNLGGPVGSGGGGGGSVPKFSKKDWDGLQKDIGQPPTCPDVIKLGHFLQDHGFSVGENNAFGGVAPVHTNGSWHDKCGGTGALDVNFGGPGDLDPQEVAAVDPIIDDLHRLGYRTIWRAPGHFNHLHVDVANSGLSMGAGTAGGVNGLNGGFTGPLEDALLQVRLIDWDAPAAQFSGLGGAGGGYFNGPPDPTAARAICQVARSLDASPKVLLAAYEAAIVESGVHSLPYGDLDSIGLYQQRDSWGSFAQRMDPVWASRQFISRAIRQNESWMSAGQLAQDVQVSKYPDRYDERRDQAMALIGKFCS
jgi:Putative Flp pilus-assembly TadE/G-like